MRVADALKLLTLGTLLCAGCKDDDGSDGAGDSGAITLSDSGSSSDAGKADAGAATDSGSLSSDSGTTDSGTTPLDSGASDASSNVITSSTGSWTVFPNPYGDAAVDGGPNPAMGIMGSARAVRAGDGGMTVWLAVSGLPAARGFGSHLHKLSCDMMTAGGHFQHMPAPDGGANDPAFANAMNEVWLDFTTNDAGAGMGSATVDFIPGAGGANALVVHDHLTADGGVAGPKLACLPLPF